MREVVTTIAIGERVVIEVGKTTADTLVLFDGEPVGAIGSLYIDLDARCMKPILGAMVSDFDSVRTDPYFVAYMRDMGFEVGVLNIDSPRPDHTRGS